MQRRRTNVWIIVVRLYRVGGTAVDGGKQSPTGVASDSDPNAAIVMSVAAVARIPLYSQSWIGACSLVALVTFIAMVVGRCVGVGVIVIGIAVPSQK